MNNFLNVHLTNIFPYAILPLITGLFIIFISTSSFLRSYRNKFSWLVFIFCGILFFWVGSHAVMVMTPFFEVAQKLKTVYVVSWLLIPPVFLHAVFIFARRQDVIPFLFYLLYATVILVVIAGGYVSVDMAYFGYFPRFVQPQGIAVMTLYYTTTAFSLLMLYDECRTAETNTRRNQAWLLWTGSTFGFIFAAPETILLISGNIIPYNRELTPGMFVTVIVAMVVMILAYALLLAVVNLKMIRRMATGNMFRNLVLAFGAGIPFNAVHLYYVNKYCYGVYPVSGIGLIIATILILYASLKYKLMDISGLVRRYLVYYTLVIIFSVSYLVILSMYTNITIIFPAIFIGFLMVAIFNPVYQLIRRTTDSILYPHRFDYQKSIRDISNQLVTVLDYEKLIELLRQSIADIMKASSFTLLLYNYDKDEYDPVALQGNVPPKMRSFSSMEGIIKLIKLVNHEIFIEELADEESGDDEGYRDFFHTFNAVLVMPMAYKGVLRGILCLGDRVNGEIYTQKDVELLQILSNQAIIALDNARLYEMAITDELTNLYIIRFFNQRIVDEIISSVRLKRELSLLMIDMDFFKEINDRYGHQTGDLVLKRSAGIIEEQVRAIDLVARYGGEEFAVILPETNNEMAFMIAERIRKKIESFSFTENIRITVSIGVATIDGKRISPAVEASQSLDHQQRKKFYNEIKETFIYHADKALYEAKGKGRNLTVNNGLLVL